MFAAALFRLGSSNEGGCACANCVASAGDAASRPNSAEPLRALLKWEDVVIVRFRCHFLLVFKAQRLLSDSVADGVACRTPSDVGKGF